MKKPATPNTIITLVLTVLTIFFWAGFEIYRSLTIKPEPPVPPEIINPLDPTLDTESLDELRTKLFLTDEEIGIIVIASPTPSPSTSPTPNPSPSASPQISPSPSIAP